MKCQILFSWKNKKNIISLSSAENAQRVVKVNRDSNTVVSFYDPYLYFMVQLLCPFLRQP